MLMRNLALAFLTIVLGTSPGARAGIIARDLQSPGDGLLTYDTVNQREWLDLPETSGLTLAEVMSQMVPNGRLEGFRFATMADVSDLAASAEVGWTTAWTLPFNLEPHAPEFVELLGWVIRSSGGVLSEMRIAVGLVAIDNTTSVPSFDDTNLYVISMLAPSPPVGPNSPSITYTPYGGVFTSGPMALSSEHPALGSGDIGPFWLYRAVPEPAATLLLLQTGASVIVVRRWRA
jgi:hypothetical protein